MKHEAVTSVAFHAPIVLQPGVATRSEGRGPGFSLGTFRGKLLVLTLDVIRVVEHGQLNIWVWGSADGDRWTDRPVTVFPPKGYSGVYSVLLNLASRPDLRFLRVSWRADRWAKRDQQPLFEFSVFLEESGSRIHFPSSHDPAYPLVPT